MAELDKSVDELLAQRMAERDQLEASIQYAPAPVPISIENEQQQPISGNFEYDASTLPPIQEPSYTVQVEYFIEFYDGKRIQIKQMGKYETYPPILMFTNEFDNTLIPFDNVDKKGIKLIIKIEDKEFSYNFDKQVFNLIPRDPTTSVRISKTGIDDIPQKTKDMISASTDEMYLLFSLKNVDEFRQIVFACYNIEGKFYVIFRCAKFRMFDDEAFQYQIIKDIEKSFHREPGKNNFHYNIYLKDKKREGATEIIPVYPETRITKSCPMIYFDIDEEIGLTLSYDRINDYRLFFVIGFRNKQYMHEFEDFYIHEQKGENDIVVKQIVYTIKDKKNENSSKLVFSLDEDNKMILLNGIFKVENEKIWKFMDAVHNTVLSSISSSIWRN